MHSYNRTMLSSLGFSDPEKQDPAHEHIQLCFSQHAQASAICAKLISMLEPKTIKWHSEGVWHSEVEIIQFDRLLATKIETPISKGSDKYKTTIGFVDILYTVELRHEFKDHKDLLNPDVLFPPDKTHVRRGTIGIEVKTGPLKVSEIIRQINLYREYTSYDYWLVLTPHKLSDTHKNVFESENVFCFTLV